MKRPLVSIVIPVYNVKKYVGQCISSVLAQTYGNIEVLCVDDCGSDDSMRIVDGLARRDKRIRILRQPRNMGLGPARNLGLERGRGEYVLFLDSDDYLMPGIVEKLVARAVNTGADMVVSRSRVLLEDESQSARAKSMRGYLHTGDEQRYQIAPDSFRGALDKMAVVAWGRLYSAKFLESNKIRFARANIAHEDDGFMVKLCSCFPLVSFVHDIGVAYRIRAASIVSGTGEARMAVDLRAALDDAFEFIRGRAGPLADMLVGEVKSMYRYGRMYADGCHVPPDDSGSARISVLGVPLLRVKWDRSRKRLYLLGLRLLDMRRV
jgi:glycosyltransferase involved in cell wall biosynthesis